VEEADVKIIIRNRHSTPGEALRRKRRLFPGMSFVVAGGLIGFMGFAFPETSSAGENGPSAAITVQIYNYSQASPAILTGAEREAGRILTQAGLRAVWLDCPVVPFTVDSHAPCQKAPEATDIRLRVLTAPIQNKFQDTVFGFTVHPVLASVYYEYVVRLAKTDDAEFELPIILGCAIAHEIGHLLLGPNNHSADGIMRAKWERKQVEQAMWGTLLFTSEQSKVIQAEARRRTLTPSSDTPGPDFAIIGGSERQQRLVACIAEATWLLRDRADLQQAMTFVILEHDKFLQSRAAFHAYRTKLAYSNLAIRRIYLSSRVLADRDTALWGVGHELGHFMIPDGTEGHAEFAAERIRWRARQTCGSLAP
jgi:hypothetical protein